MAAPGGEGPRVLRVDIVSDVVCPWCLIGFRQLERALADLGVEADLRWHPFELNPGMPPEGEEVASHIARKYGASAERMAETRAAMADVAAGVGVAFRPGVPARMWNTRDAHRLLFWARDTGRQTALALALFDAHFGQGANLADHGVLADAADAAGLDRAEAAAVLASGRFADAVASLEARFAEMGVTGVPAFILGERGLAMGAQGVEWFRRVLPRFLPDGVPGAAA
ncbi:DsbA family oxidoreductase [Thermaurantiacus tibetensis]|uniref:DsbA family oxidoreductase n=1 Tax=Thermaurantiacus tibetensis TaxID=2759035 RepID=UPI00189083FC|nr:DsbA family oxidoreductase [Thermaurantiacus tibetensis]